MFVDRNEQGRIVAIYANPQRDGHEYVEGAEIEPDPSLIVEAKLSAVRTAREAILNRLSGIAFRAEKQGDAATVNAYLQVSQGLLQITDGLKDIAPELIDVTVMERYVLLREQCTPAMVSAFAQVDA